LCTILLPLAGEGADRRMRVDQYNISLQEFQMQYQTGNFLLETILAISLIAFFIISFSTYSLNLNHHRNKNQTELTMAKQLIILSERLYHTQNPNFIFQQWQKETKTLLPDADIVFEQSQTTKKIKFKLEKEQPEREILL
jgi:hypothetical protein